ncbi:hypothetical protein SAMN05421771_2484 [Granulicella pectinivorans]|uniref:Uncharacterized protein n=1 Tax=Granulicella pectinivorans TaxID=474950 RepID=A0A1I6MEY0_9BACT|nr:hypothetical protein [Granulicella pectinivorans]SFS14201.1 hypothetical protein SAMN05421771_2484 [Granulicella pectinivorans]
MITLHAVTDFALCVAAIIAGLGASGKMIQMTHEVNRRLPVDDRLMEVFWYPGQARKVATAHRLFFPESKLRNRRNIFAVLMVVFLCAWLVVGQFYF